MEAIAVGGNEAARRAGERVKLGPTSNKALVAALDMFGNHGYEHARQRRLIPVNTDAVANTQDEPMNKLIGTLCAAATVAGCALPACAQNHQPESQSRTTNGPLHLDQRYQHDHYYPAPGFAVRTLPPRSVSVRHGQANFFYHGGVWFRPSGSRFIVAVPPIGVIVPYLPPAYVFLRIGGAPYYYANGVYYARATDGYAVVARPEGSVLAQPAAPTIFIYPRNGQSAQQIDADRAACDAWATAQPGTTQDPSGFQRALAACMDGRGYTVR